MGMLLILSYCLGMHKKRTGQNQMVQMLMRHQKLRKHMATGRKRKREHMLGQKGWWPKPGMHLARADCWIEIG